MAKSDPNTKTKDNDGAMQRMDAALKAALKMPSRKHKYEPKRKPREKSTETNQN